MEKAASQSVYFLGATDLVEIFPLLFKGAPQNTRHSPTPTNDVALIFV
jgi:hypothetical protein